MAYAITRHDVEVPAIAPDLTMGFDPAAIWPDPMDCPRYPFFELSKAMTSREALRERLVQLVVSVNGYALEYAAPDPDAVAGFVADHFKPKPPRLTDTTTRYCDAMGAPFAGNVPDQHKAQRAMALIEAVHLRGWLRKLDALDAQAKAEAQTKAERQAQARLDEWQREVVELTAAIADRAEAEARHRQRIADEKAAKANTAARYTLKMHHAQATEAARVLGIDPPELPKECGG